MRYQIFSDESGHSRFRSIGVLSGKKTEIDNLRNELIIILEKKDRDSIEFKKIDGDKNKEKVAIDFVEKGIEYCVNEKILDQIKEKKEIHEYNQKTIVEKYLNSLESRWPKLKIFLNLIAKSKCQDKIMEKNKEITLL